MNQQTEFETTSQPNRLLDELIRYVRERSADSNGEKKEPITDERLLRTVVRQLRRHPIPASLLGASLIWLLLADEEDNGETPFARQVEDEIVSQIQGGFDYTSTRLREITDQYPWAVGATLVAGGLGAAFLLPRKRRQRKRPAEKEAEITKTPGDPFRFESTEEDEDPPLR